MTSFLSKRWNDKISDTKSGTVRKTRRTGPKSGTIRVLPLAHASVLLFWEARDDNKKQSKDNGGFQKHYWASWSFTCCTHGITEAQHGDHFFKKLAYRRRRNLLLNMIKRGGVLTGVCGNLFVPARRIFIHSKLHWAWMDWLFFTTSRSSCISS